MSLSSILLPPLIGGVIGYITNDLAIKMLFRPYTAKYIGKHRLPFTPGIVPKRLQQLAVLLGREVEARFFNADDLEILFQSDSFSEAVAESLTDLLYSRKMSLCWELETLERDPEMGEAAAAARRRISRYIVSAIADMELEPVIRAAAEGLERVALPKAALQFAPAIASGVKRYFVKEADAAAEHIDSLLVDFADRPVKDIAAELLPDRELTKKLIKRLYGQYMAQYVRAVVESIDVGGMITDKLRLMEPKAVEALVLSVVNREFRYVVWLGGALGMLIGAVNIFI